MLYVAAAKGVLANDRDPEGGALAVTQVRSGPSHGQIQWAANGSFTYTPEQNFAGTDSFEYVVRDRARQRGHRARHLQVSNSPTVHAPMTTNTTPSRTRGCA